MVTDTEELEQEAQEEQEEPAEPRAREDVVVKGPTVRPKLTREELNEVREDGTARALQMLYRIKSGTATKRQAREAINLLIESVNEMEPEDASRLFADEEFQELINHSHKVSGAKPGDAIYDRFGREIDRIPLTAEYQKELYEMVEWTPMKDEYISVNGVSWRVFAGRVNKTPNIIRDVAMEAWNMTREAMASQQKVLGETGAADGTTFETGWAGKPEITGSTPGWIER